MEITPYNIAKNMQGLREIAGPEDNPFIVWAMQLSNPSVDDDETPWCSGIMNGWHVLAGFERSRSNAARSWLYVGESIELSDAQEGDVVILSRPEAGSHAGHVGFLIEMRHRNPDGHSLEALGPMGVMLYGGNQGDAMSIAWFDADRVIGVRRPRPLHASPIV